MDLLQSGQKLSLNFAKNDDTLVEIIGTISEVFDDRLIIELPPYFMRYIEFLDMGRVLTVKVFSKMGTIDFNSIIISSPLEEGHLEIELDCNALKFTPGNEIPKIDSIDNLKIIRSDGEFQTQSFEISTDYIKFYSDQELSIDENFDCELILPEDYGKISFKANVTEHDIIYDNEYKASYYSMSEDDRETLLYYMYVYTNNLKENQEQDEKNNG